MDITRNQRKVLYHLECDARTSQNRIARNCAISQQSVSYNIDRLLEQKAIGGFATLFDYSRLDYNGYLCMLRLEKFSRASREKLMEQMEETGLSAWIYATSGAFDVVSLLLARNASQLNKRISNMEESAPAISRREISPAIAVHEAGKKYLNDGFTDREVENRVLGADRQPLQIKSEREHLLRNLLKRPRMSMVDAAKDTDCSSKTLLQWRKELEEKKIIRGYRPVLGEGSGINRRLALLELSSKPRENKIRDYMIRQENMVSVVKTLGRHDLVVEIQAEGSQRIMDSLRTMRESFGDLVENQRLLDLEQKKRKGFLPDSHFD